MFLTVALPSGPVMIDPGFGGQAPRVPIPVGGDAPGYTFHRDGELHVLRDRDQELWVSTLARELAIDFEMMNHFTATHGSSPFTRMLLMNRFTPGGRISLANRELKIEGVVTQLADGAALRVAIATHFGIDLPEIADLKI